MLYMDLPSCDANKYRLSYYPNLSQEKSIILLLVINSANIILIIEAVSFYYVAEQIPFI